MAERERERTDLLVEASFAAVSVVVAGPEGCRVCIKELPTTQSQFDADESSRIVRLSV